MAIAFGLLFLLAAPLASGGCAPRQNKNGTPPTARDVTLFFGDRQAMFVMPEARRVDPGAEPLGKVLVRELIKGPDDPFLTANMPRGTQLRSFTVKDGVARVDFSKEFRDNHPGGTAGEAMTLSSLVFTLTELPEIEKVQILIEGKTGDTLGHVVLDEPLGRGPVRTHEVFPDRERLAWLQGLVDAGREQWRRDPVEVAKRDGRMAAFRATDAFRLVEVRDETEPGAPAGAKRAFVEATHEGKKYVLTLIQPVRGADRGIWTISAIKQASQ